jgi:hypothetical protein
LILIIRIIKFILNYKFIYNLIYDLLLNLVIYILITCWKVNNGNTYLEIIYIKVSKVKNENENWLTK